jgi:AcrR family transcriptional regulator
MSARSIGEHAGVPPSGIYHHFGNLEHLYLSAQAHARSRAADWCASHLTALAAAGTMPASHLPTLLAVLIDDWAEGQRQIAFAWRECIMSASREPGFVIELEAWRSMWEQFWFDVCDLCGRAEFGQLTTLFFYNESLFHLMRWKRVLDRAGLQDLCTGWGQWLEAGLTKEGTWRRIAREESIRTMPSLPVLGELSGRIAVAAAAILRRDGLPSLTHRAVATESGLTLGVVSHNARTSADLVRAAFEMVYREATAAAIISPARLDLTDDQIVEALIGFQGGAGSLLALDELLLAVARDPSLSGFIPQLRYMRGRTSAALLPALANSQTGSPLDHALLSAIFSGLRQSCIGNAPDVARRRTEKTVTTLTTILCRPGNSERRKAKVNPPLVK